VARAAGAFEARLGPRGQTLEVRTEATGSLALAEADLVRIVTNLVENAHRHGNPGGRIAVSWGRGPRGGAQLVVDDDGPGIPGPHREAVFDRFYRADPSRSRASGGLGLGLSLVKALAEGSGGRAEASESPWGGCRITVVWT